MSIILLFGYDRHQAKVLIESEVDYAYAESPCSSLTSMMKFNVENLDRLTFPFFLCNAQSNDLPVHRQF